MVMDEFLYDVKIPKDRVAVLIGKKGEVKKIIEIETKTKIEVDSKEGDVFLKGEDALGLYTAREIVMAVGRGFHPQIALTLLKVDYIYESLDLTDYAGKSKDHMERIKGRIIGREGKSRKLIEELSEASLAVYGKTVSIIGPAESVTIARSAIEMLLRGSTHAAMYTMLERQRRELKGHKLFESFSPRPDEGKQ